jgi:sulfate adenylyltransferase subunit 1 (EFTu-like GTPase family)
MSDESLAFVMVGHIDHGKSTLIGRLLYDTDSLPDGKMEEIEAAARQEGRPLEFGYVVDHLAEERSRGITIDTAQIFFSGEARDYVIIDAPGHKEFIKNMITGASQAEAAVLICSAFEGVQEQTKRHAYVIKLLGLDQVLVAYNKMDLVGYEQARFEAVRGEMDAFLERLGVSPRVEVPVSAAVGDNIAGRSENMPWYDGPTVLEGLDLFRKMPAPTEKALRFPIQDIYVRGGKSIAAGRVESGVLRKGDRLRFLPGDKVCTVQEIRQYLRDDMPSAEAGECIGVLFDADGLRRGQVGCPVGDNLTMTRRLGASVFWLSPRPLETEGQERLVFKCATQEVPCRVAAISERLNSSTLEQLDPNAGRLEETEVGDMVLEADEPVVVESFYDVAELGRFVLVRGHDVVAGGIVTAGRA